ncbi:MAG: cell division protein FtsQ/DivIB [Minisyncoccota bacterium]
MPFRLSEGRPKRSSPLRTKRRRARALVAALAFVATAVLAYGVHLISYAPPLSIQKIEVTGVKKIEPTIISSYVDSLLNDGSFHYLSRRNIFLYPKNVIEQGIIASFPRVKSARAYRPSAIGQNLVIAITEREPFALWCAAEDDCYALDEEGFVFTTAATTTHGDFATAYTFTGDIEGAPIGQKLIPGQLPSVLALLRIFQQETNLVPTRVDILPEQDFWVTVGQDFYVKASFGQEPETLARNLELVLSSEALRERIAEIEYVDLRFGNRVYYKMKGEEQKNI